jgi:hypothetical protein
MLNLALLQHVNPLDPLLIIYLSPATLKKQTLV